MSYQMRDRRGNVCPECGGTGKIRNLATLAPSDDEPCPCTDSRRSTVASQRRQRPELEAVARNWL
jgi:hypothetical protein